MEASSVSHIAMCVRDLDKSLAFYRDALGMTVTLDQVQDTTRGGLPFTYKHARATRRTVHLRYGGASSVPFLVITNHPGEAPDGEPIKLDQVGISHISFTVPDTKALAENLQSQGYELAAPLDAFSDAEGNVGSIFVYDSDGILVQFDKGAGG